MFGKIFEYMLEAVRRWMKRSRLPSVGRLSIARGRLNTNSPLAAKIYRPSKRFTLTFSAAALRLSCEN